MPIDSVFSGYNPELEDRLFLQTGSYALPFTPKDYQAPEEIDPRPFIRHDDQGNMGSCGGHGSTNTGEYVWALPMARSVLTGNSRGYSPTLRPNGSTGS